MLYSWSPDGARLAVAAGSRLLVASPTGRTRHIGPQLVSDTYASPLWSADGTRLTVAAHTVTIRPRSGASAPTAPVFAA